MPNPYTAASLLLPIARLKEATIPKDTSPRSKLVLSCRTKQHLSRHSKRTSRLTPTRMIMYTLLLRAHHQANPMVAFKSTIQWK